MPSARCARRTAAAAHRPNAPSTCSHAPAAAVLLGDRRERIERAGVDVAGLRAHDRRGRERRQRVGAHAALAVDGDAHEAVAPEAGEPERLDQRRVCLLADHDRDRRRAEEAVGLDVPVLAREHRVSRGGERGEVRHRRPGDERARAAGGQPEEVAHPSSAMLSSCDTAGVGESNAAFWSHAVASQFAASAAGSEPPITKPKKRGPAMAMVAGEPSSSSSASTSAASDGPSGNGSRRSARRATASAGGATPRSWIPAR